MEEERTMMKELEEGGGSEPTRNCSFDNFVHVAEILRFDYLKKSTKKLLNTPNRMEQELERERLPKRSMMAQDQQEENKGMQLKRMKRDDLVRRSEDSDGKKDLPVRKPKRPSGRTRTTTSNNNMEKKDKNKRDMCNIEIPNQSPDLPDDFEKKILEIGGFDKQLVITKRLYNSDCKRGEQRLSMPLSETADFLYAWEKVHLQGRNALNRKNGIPVKLIQPDPNLNEIEINLREWDMFKKNTGRVSKIYALVKPWHDVVMNNGLKEGDTIQVWSFRVGEEEKKLWLAIVKL